MLDSILGTNELAILVAIVGLVGAVALSLWRSNLALRRRIRRYRNNENLMNKLNSAIANNGAIVIITDQDGTIEYVNQQLCKRTGFLHHELIGQSLNMLKPKDISDELALLELKGVKDSWEGEVLCTTKAGSSFWCALTVSPVEDADEVNETTNYVISAIDISDLKAANQQLENLALFDSLTGLANRRLFNERLNSACRKAKQKQVDSTLFILDLDKFKRINDTLGHQSGDELLLIVAERLKQCVSEHDTVARLGGDEFTILLKHNHNSTNVESIANNILRTLKQPIKLGKHEVSVSTSIGITSSRFSSGCSETLLKHADLALYRAKDKGRDCYHIFTEDLNDQAARQLEIESELRQALQNNEFYLNYQPQANLKTGEISSVEALIRWRHPERGDIPPSEFVPVAEETGLIVEIGDWVIKTACLEIQRLYQQCGIKLTVAVNLSPRQFHDKNLIETVNCALKNSGLEASSLELEVTESMLMHDIDEVIELLNRIKKTGTSIAIDDFGSGYSSLSYLRSLPVDILKIDREFVRDIPEDLSAMEIASAIIAVAHKLGLKVIAEGVEDEDQRDFLAINHCDFAQGYHYSRPLHYQGLREFFEQRMLKDLAEQAPKSFLLQAQAI